MPSCAASRSTRRDTAPPRLRKASHDAERDPAPSGYPLRIVVDGREILRNRNPEREPPGQRTAPAPAKRRSARGLAAREAAARHVGNAVSEQQRGHERIRLQHTGGEDLPSLLDAGVADP